MGSHDCTLMIEATERHVGTVIVLHGMGEIGEQWHKLAISYEWGSRFPHLRFLFPTAPEREISLVPGSSMSAWFDILSTNDVRGGVHDEAGLDAARAWLERLVRAEIAQGLEPQNILLVGFSQGGSLALYAGATMASSVGAVLAISSYLPMAPRVQERLVEAAAGGSARRQTTFVLANGTNDPQVKFPWAQWSVDALEQGGCKTRLISYLRKGHSIRAETLKDIHSFIAAHVPYDIAYDLC